MAITTINTPGTSATGNIPWPYNTSQNVWQPAVTPAPEVTKEEFLALALVVARMSDKLDRVLKHLEDEA